MAIRTAVTGLMVGCVLLTFGTGPAAAGNPIGQLHRIDIKADHPRAYHPRIGDLMQCYIDFPVVPEQIVDQLKVTIDGTSVALVATVNTSKPKIVGSGQYSAYFVPRGDGLSKVTILPVITGQRPKPIVISVLVNVPDE